MKWLLLLFLFLIFFILNLDLEKKEKYANYSCVKKVEEKIVRGRSLKGIIEEREKVLIYYDYYECNEVKRNDIVAIRFLNKTIIKVVKGIPGDNFEIFKSKDYYLIKINGIILKNSFGEEYRFSENDIRLLSIYEKSYNKKIPEDAYLVLGNFPSTLDSTKFGLIGKDYIIGKVEKMR